MSTLSNPTPARLAPDDWVLQHVGRPLRAAGRSLQRRPAVQAMRRLWILMDREGFIDVSLVFLGVFLAGGVIVFIIEQATFFSENPDDAPLITDLGIALWYSIVTMASVGYGDYTPKTPLGRLVGGFLILLGVILFSYVSAQVAAILVANRIREGRGLDTVKLKNHVLICGWNLHGERVLEGIKLAQGAERTDLVLVNELSEDAITEIFTRIEGLNVTYVRGDPAVEAVLNRAAAADARAAIVLADASHGTGIPTDERTTLIILALNGIKKDLKICAEALELESEPHLKRAGADDLVIRGEFNGFLMSSAALSPGVPEVARQVLALGASELRRQPIPEEFVGKTFGELFSALRATSGFLALAVVTEAKGLALDDLLTDDYSLVDNFIKDSFSAAGMEHLRFAEGGIQVTVNPPDAYVVGPSDTAIGIGLGQWQTSAA